MRKLCVCALSVWIRVEIMFIHIFVLLLDEVNFAFPCFLGFSQYIGLWLQVVLYFRLNSLHRKLLMMEITEIHI